MYKNCKYGIQGKFMCKINENFENEYFGRKKIKKFFYDKKGRLEKKVVKVKFRKKSKDKKQKTKTKTKTKTTNGRTK